MIDIVGVCYRFIGDVVQTFKAPKTISSTQIDANPIKTDSGPQNCVKFNEFAAEALTTIFGMDAEGRIKKERARRVVEDLGLIGTEQEGNGFELLGSSEDELRVEEIVDGLDDEDAIRRAELLRRAFTVFDEDGDGYIEAMEVKRVLECLGLAKGWGVEEFEKMVQVADLNFDGKVDFGEFELMMGVKM